jgi:hypothetical protein
MNHLGQGLEAPKSFAAFPPLPCNSSLLLFLMNGLLWHAKGIVIVRPKRQEPRRYTRNNCRQTTVVKLIANFIATLIVALAIFGRRGWCCEKRLRSQIWPGVSICTLRKITGD